MPDYYKILEVSNTANEDEIKKAYRKLAMKCHPDRHKGDKAAEQKFKEINEAYEVLKDPQKKAAYDRYGSSAFENGGFNQQSGSGFSGFDFGGGFAGFDFEDILGEVFGGGTRRKSGARAVQPGSDIRFDLSISLEDAFFGTVSNVRYRTFCKCEKCFGFGSADKTSAVCTVCGGSGSVRMQQGFFTIEKTCANCNGSGTIMKNPCSNCAGLGRIYKDKNLDVKIPKGVQHGMKIRLASEGEAGVCGGQAGDLYVFVSIRDHKIFKRDDNNLVCSMPISMVSAALGAELEVTTLDKQKAELKIPAGTQTGEKIKLKGRGMPNIKGNGYGDMLVEVTIETPVKLTKKQKELLKDFEKSGEVSENNPKSNFFFAKIKDFFDK
jgi:molecular chaperone DnaJ